MNYASKMILTVMASSLLAGCQSFPFSKLGFGKPRPTATMPPVVDQTGLVVLGEGQEQLRRGNISAAVASFRVATLDPDSRAGANNGLGIAYAKLGRADLANRYFSTAALLDPANTKYAANLERLERKEYFAMRARDEARMAEATAQTPPEAPATFAAAFGTPVTEHVSITKEPAASITRISRSEVRISGGAQASAATRMRVEYRQSKVAAGKQDLSEQAEGAEPEYPLRVAVVSKSKTIRPAYPVRIDLKK
jgi:tetratricopeptide (TPR) repeat protein